jgi:putative ABC transport system ATP-binding protein
MARPVIELRAVSKIYGSGDTIVRAVDRVDLVVERGDYVAVMGASGSGKSTLMNIIGCLDGPTTGRYLLDGVDVRRLDERRQATIRNRKIGFIFQSFNLIPTLTAEENITLSADLAGRSVDREWFDYLVGRLRIADRTHHRPSELSGGQQQRVACARALIGRPDLIFADEPTGNLDSKASGELLGLLRNAVDELGQTVIMVTHDAVAASYADRLLVLGDGRIVHDGQAATAGDVLDLMKAVG